MNISIGFSPCPNDTFIFDALVNRKIDTAGINFVAVLEDVETLNQWALQQKLEVTKLSYGVFPLVLNNYSLLNSGSALGTGVGPLLISSGEKTDKELLESTIAIPGKNTTAHLLFSMAYPNARNKVFLRYDEIENFVLQNKTAGVIIHENRFTYEQRGLHRIKDLGDYWEKVTGNPIPLGGIVARKDMEPELQHKIDGLIKKSIEYAFMQYPLLNDYIRNHAQEMSEEVMRKHINLYVNEYSLNLGIKGEEAIKKVIEIFNAANATQIPTDHFLV